MVVRFKLQAVGKFQEIPDAQRQPGHLTAAEAADCASAVRN